MGEVYEVYSTLIARWFVLETLRRELGDDEVALRRSTAETQVFAIRDHLIVTVLATGATIGAANATGAPARIRATGPRRGQDIRVRRPTPSGSYTGQSALQGP